GSRRIARTLFCTEVELAAGFTPAATLFLTSAKRRYEQPFRKVPTVYRKESRPVAKRPADEREPSGFPTDVELAAGFTPAATLFLTSAKRRYEQPFRKVPTLYRKESRPVPKRPADERAPSVFPLIP